MKAKEKQDTQSKKENKGFFYLKLKANPKRKTMTSNKTAKTGRCRSLSWQRPV